MMMAAMNKIDQPSRNYSTEWHVDVNFKQSHREEIISFYSTLSELFLCWSVAPRPLTSLATLLLVFFMNGYRRVS
jgi:hypothetical protein